MQARRVFGTWFGPAVAAETPAAEPEADIGLVAVRAVTAAHGQLRARLVFVATALRLELARQAAGHGRAQRKLLVDGAVPAAQADAHKGGRVGAIPPDLHLHTGDLSGFILLSLRQSF
eukprot:COSAG02_NODE_6570_length_3488_cov_2.521393_1_plen_118_part_00